MDAIRQDFKTPDPESNQVAAEFLENMSFILGHNPNHFDAFFESILQFPFSGGDRVLDSYLNGAKNWEILLIWGDEDGNI